MTALERIDGETFIRECWWPERGEHATLIGPTGCGKTTLGLKLVAKQTTTTPHLRGLALAMKPHKGPKSQKQGWRAPTGDETVARLTRQLGGKITRHWPPSLLQAGGKEPPFWALWPTHTMDPYTDAPAHAAVFGTALIQSYAKGDHAIFCDETYSLTKELGLSLEVTTLLTKGRSMGISMYSATQRPAHVPMAVYSEASHFLLWRTRDAGSYDRLKEIGNVDPKLIVSTLGRLRKHDCLYLYPPGDIMCIVT